MIEKLINELSVFSIIENYDLDKIQKPRVTTILSSMLHEEYLMQWANHLGFKRQSYKKTLNTAAVIGTHSHNAVENYIRNEQNNIDSITDSYVRLCTQNCLNSFIEWYNIISNTDFEVVAIEQSLECEWYRGTFDMLIKINGKVYLVDFKTSNHVSYKYMMQLCAYRYMIINSMNIQVDGFIILQLSKNEVCFNEYILDFENEEEYKFMQLCTNGFMSLVHSYYYRQMIEMEYKNIMKRRYEI